MTNLYIYNACTYIFSSYLRNVVSHYLEIYDKISIQYEIYFI